MKDKILNFIMAILVILLLVIAMFKTSSKDFQNKVYKEINTIRIQYLGKMDKNIANPKTESSINRQVKQKLDEPDFGPYMKDLQKRIKAKWEPPKGNESKRAIVLFKIAKNGELLKIRIFKTSGVFAVDNAALKAIKDTAPFKPLPKEFKGKSIDIQFTFDYNVFNKKKCKLF